MPFKQSLSAREKKQGHQQSYLDWRAVSVEGQHDLTFKKHTLRDLFYIVMMKYQ